MKKIKLAVCLILVLMACSSAEVFAQKKIRNTSSARAAYGFAPPATKQKKKKHKAAKHVKAREKNPAYRRRGNWAS